MDVFDRCYSRLGECAFPGRSRLPKQVFGSVGFLKERTPDYTHAKIRAKYA